MNLSVINNIIQEYCDVDLKLDYLTSIVRSGIVVQNNTSSNSGEIAFFNGLSCLNKKGFIIISETRII